MPENSRTYAAIHLILSLIAHVVLIGPAVYIIILVAGLEYTLFLWHPTCMALGVGLLMAEAVFSISGDALITSRVSRGGRIQLHYIMHALGLALLIVGFATVVANKNINNANHFTSSHGIMGLTSFIISLLVAIGGIFMVRNSQLSGRTAIVKIFHGCLGTIAMIFLFITLILGLYRPWKPYSDLGRGLVVAAYIIGAVLTLSRPLWGSLHRIRALVF